MASAALEAAIINPNARAFLDMVAKAEGTLTHGYHTLVGGSRIASLAQHPNKLVRLSATLSSTAAGRYQFLKRTWDALQKKLGLPDFGPRSQDLAALELIREKGALTDVVQGRVEQAINKTRKVWASFPGAGYGQGERSMTYMLNAYRAAGGVVNAPATTQPPTTAPPTTAPPTTAPPITAPPINGEDLNKPAVSGGLIVIAAGILIFYFVFQD